MGMDKFRPRVVVLLSSEPCAASDDAYNYANQWEKPSFLAALLLVVTQLLHSRIAHALLSQRKIEDCLQSRTNCIPKQNDKLLTTNATK